MNKIKSLQPQAIDVLIHKNTEKPNKGKYNHIEEKGTYLCRQCGLALFRSTHKFLSSCGWPSFDDEIPQTIKRQLDKDGIRTEILCSRCESHLGHVFIGEKYTEKNLRHCVNSLSIELVNDQNIKDSEEGIFAGGCFWGVQHLLNQLPGVLKTEAGYTGGDANYPTYREVCSGKTGHLEAVRVLYDPSCIDYQTLTKHFLEIHDPTQANGQGPDIGAQYQSAIFYFNEQQKKISEELLAVLQTKGYKTVTKLLEVKTFWPAEDYHQYYYQKNTKAPYCHTRAQRF